MDSIYSLSLSTTNWWLNALIVFATLGLWALFRSGSRNWQATVTPLASIIGSGFLVVAPLLGLTIGRWSLLGIIAIVTVAYLVGGAIRFNIANLEDIVATQDHDGRYAQIQGWLEQISNLVLAFAYIIAITFYLELLGAFILRLLGTESDLLQKSIASALMLFIAIFGLWRGLSMLESLESYAVRTKLAIIAILLLGLAWVNLDLVWQGDWALPNNGIVWNTDTLRKLLGAFLIVQGFETSKYLRGEYPVHMRIATMRQAQSISALIYCVFIALSTVLMDSFNGVSETGIISLAERVADLLPLLLVIGAVMSQFSAAVADTIGTGGLIEEVSHDRISRHHVYAAAMGLALALLWSSHILTIIAYASRAFALYYGIQCAMAALHAFHCRPEHSLWKAGYFLLLSILMLLTAIFALPVESVSG